VEQGDLATWTQPRIVLILEGVLAHVRADISGRFRRKIVLSYQWLPTPIKRLRYLKDNYPDVSIEVVTFVNQEAADYAAEFFDTAGIPVSSVTYRPFNRWVEEIKWQPDIQTIYDSDVPRSMCYGQRGYVVQKGEDF
jgi:hypothetical protein